MADQVDAQVMSVSVAQSAESVATTETVNSSSNYVPQVGDVVEFDDGSKKWQGIVFWHRCNTLCVSGAKGSPKIYSKAEKHPLKKIGHTHLMDDVTEWGGKQREAVKAYFSAPTFTGSYAERQQQWIKHHGLKVGDKVKVVRKFYGDEDGWDGYDWNSEDSKMRKQGEVMVIEKIHSKRIVLDANHFPYFALEPVK